MLLYDIYYYGRGIDNDVALPDKPLKGTKYAICKNGPIEMWVPKKGEWVRGSLEKEPPCKFSDSTHDFQPVPWGCKENPGRWSEGGMMIMVDRCRFCGAIQIEHRAISTDYQYRMQEKTYWLPYKKED